MPWYLWLTIGFAFGAIYSVCMYWLGSRRR